ncbi:MAG TPA: heme o synthase [Chitinophagaceae bacterium]|nr:heme o synthase [Chitinophagaceae bacterium]MCC6634765.1 protoheme IX farnesyltransferase [Chitinophagaceae bacterium]HMZ45491.1 heme o synthase [Chitinophagaceae bacterium]HNF30283.1 heme o synthase [Chitinophagaceae bacterium]HNM35020.1 heme o synthase [Chitinophagaceae bacterium]
MTDKSLTYSTSFLSKLHDYKELTKFTLTFTVVFTCVISYLLAPSIISYNLKMILLLFAAGLLITGSANAINQAVEKNSDALMKRTANRPVAAGRMSQKEAYTFAFLTGAIGVFIMWYFFNTSSALLSAFSLFLYSFIYTPLKTKNSIAVLIGGLPGALPCLIGWVAAEDSFSIGGWILFAIQFIWQFPHFWAIAWVAHKDYTAAGFKLLPSNEGPTKYTAIQTIMYSVLMIPIGLLPYYFNITGSVSMYIILACNIAMVIQSIRLYNQMNVKAAKRVMFSSYIYLPIVYLAMLADKIAIL